MSPPVGSARAGVVGASTGAAIPDSGVSRWEFDEGSGTTATDSWGSNDGSITGATYTTSAQVGSHALSFVATENDEVTLPPLGFTGDVSISISAWINPNSIHKGNIYGQGTTGTGNAVCSIRTVESGAAGDYKFYFWSNDLNAASNYADYSAQGWIHLVAVYDAGNSTRTIYEDASSIASDNPTNPSFDDGNNSIGGFNSEWFDGIIDDPRIYNKALTATEVSNLRSTGSIDG